MATIESINRRNAKNEAIEKWYQFYLTLKWTRPKVARFMAKQMIQNLAAQGLRDARNNN
jgi:hypothetical protein